MKIARYLPMAILGLFVIALRASADPSASDPADNPYAPYTKSDADGVPLSVTQPQSRRFSPEEIRAIRKLQEQAALNKNWLLRTYEQQLQAHAAANSSGEQDANLYYQLSSNKELAKLAGLPPLDIGTQDSKTPYRIGATPSDQPAVKLRGDASSTATGDSPSHGNLFKPLVTPLSAPEAAGLHNFYSSPFLPFSTSASLPGSPPKPPPAPSADQSQDSSDIETPGMIAAEKNPLTDTSAPDLTLDVLPGESIEHAKAHQDNNTTLLELPLPMDANQLHKAQALALSVPSLPNTAQTPAPAPVKAVPINDEDAPLPVSKIPQINPVRAPIANPYDILNR